MGASVLALAVSTGLAGNAAAAPAQSECGPALAFVSPNGVAAYCATGSGYITGLILCAPPYNRPLYWRVAPRVYSNANDPGSGGGTSKIYCDQYLHRRVGYDVQVG